MTNEYRKENEANEERMKNWLRKTEGRDSGLSKRKCRVAILNPLIRLAVLAFSSSMLLVFESQMERPLSSV